MEKNIVKEIREYVEDESLKNDRGFHKEWIIHVKSVFENASKLTDVLGVDREIIFLSCWLHDIGSIIHNKKSTHHITGAEIAEKKLKELNYPEEKIQKVKHCILAHRGSQNIKRETIEAKIVADADAMSHFDNVWELEKAELVLGKITDKSEVKKKVKEKLKQSWNKLSFQESKELIKPKYDAVMLLLE